MPATLNRTPRGDARAATLRVGGISSVPAVLRDCGVDPDKVLSAVGLDPRLFDDPDNMITYTARGRLIAHCVDRTRCQHFGLLVGEKMGLNSLGLVGLLTKSLSGVEAALQSLISHLHLHSQGGIMALRIDGELAVLSYDMARSRSTAEAVAQIGDGAVAMMLNAMRELCGPEFQPAQVRFAHRKPENPRPFQQFFKAPLWFDSKEFALLFPRDWLDVRRTGTDPELQRLLQKQVDGLESKHSYDFPEQVRSVLRSSLLSGHISLAQVAEIFSIPSWTLSRRLEASGTGFKALIDECRFELAQQMLQDTSLTINQIAEALGYERASSFIRAFRRWAGSTPSRWRAERATEM